MKKIKWLMACLEGPMEIEGYLTSVEISGMEVPVVVHRPYRNGEISKVGWRVSEYYTGFGLRNQPFSTREEAIECHQAWLDKQMTLKKWETAVNSKPKLNAGGPE